MGKAYLRKRCVRKMPAVAFGKPYCVRTVVYWPDKTGKTMKTVMETSDFTIVKRDGSADRFSLDWENVIAAHGYIIACCDGRGTGYMGEKFKKQTYGNLGALEVEDQISFARYLGEQPYVDAGRIGIYGWSYGGFMALGCACKGGGIYKLAIAVAPVTSWRYYDTIYTEIYNDLPQDNPAGYDDNSPINFAQLLDDEHTQLLIMHGTADDNVHFQNTMEMCRALNRAGKQYDMMIYPDQNHSMYPSDGYNIRRKMVEYTLRNL